MFFLRTTPLDYFQLGHPRGTCHIDFVSKDGAIATILSSAKRPISIDGRVLRVSFSEGRRCKPVTTPNDQLYYLGCDGDKSEIKAIFQQFEDDIVSIYQSMLFTL